ncbi:CBL-interacting protein kinase 2-like [Durio zibethinus]|uniref:non-specific serine/threonine protein kinase n=1 Tax=Durio zibethinus TaxID=66656 RepID=A0A6P6AIX4_DURZI|nr:CBL-interacting protein kinase 2-like [Durio zibethinus]XP_022764843.1 CBL-interacting protein kinase 2-like [Durio zibethinus]
MENKGKVLMQKYEFGRLLGQGNFAKVYYARNIETNQSVAIKVIDKEKVLNVGMIDQTKREISVMSLVKHPNILELYEVMASKSKIYFVMEYAKGGELFNRVSKGKLREDMARKYFQQLISAVDFCHSRGFYHRDLKLENLLLDENGILKVSDFGLSAIAECKHQDGLLHTTCGTPAYVAPEVINRKGYDGAKADIWSCGVILYVLVAGYLPFHDSNLIAMYRKISKADYKFPTWFSPEVSKLLSRILNPNPKARISIAKIMTNPWFKKGFNSKPVQKKDEMELAPLNIDAVLGSETNYYNAFEAKKDNSKLTNLNAFDIISLSSGFDLSGLFAKNDEKKEVKFTSMHTASAITSKLEEIAQNLKLKVKKNDGGLLKMEGSNGGRKGALAIDAEIFEFTPSFHLVEMRKSNGDTLEFRKMLQQDVRPALKDIVWAWQGEQQQQQQQQQLHSS